MAGSYAHCTRADGSFRDNIEEFCAMIENLGDAYEACEQMHYMIKYLAGGDRSKIEDAVFAFYAGFQR